MYLKERLYQAALAKKIVLDHFTYVATWAPLPLSAAVPVIIPISSDSDFAWMETTGVAYRGVNNLDPAPDLLLQFSDTGSGRNFQDNPIHWSNIVGNGQWPYVLPEPKLLIGNGSLQINLINNVAVAETRVDIALIGVKIFYLRGFNRDLLTAGI